MKATQLLEATSWFVDADTVRYDQYEDGTWYHHTGRDLVERCWVYSCGEYVQRVEAWGEYVDNEGNVRFMR